MPNTLEVLAAQNIQRVVDELQNINAVPDVYKWYGRIPSVYAEDGEILARYTRRILLAEIIPNDQAAVVRQSNPIRTSQTTIPNIKHGELITQAMLTILSRIENGLATRRDFNIFEDYIARRAIDIRNGVIARIEHMLCRMLIDDLDYNKLGVKLESVSWGMESALKAAATGGVWSVSADATPITAIQTMLRTARQTYGVVYNRLTMSSATFQEMVATTEFRNMSQLYSSIAFPAGTFPLADTNLMMDLAGRILGLTIETYDAQVFEENANGTVTTVELMPVDFVVFTNTQWDGDAGQWDFANGTVIETQPGRVPNMIGDFGGEREGPVAYATGADPNGNPPGVILWGAARGFPRKHNLAVNALLTT